MIFDKRLSNEEKQAVCQNTKLLLEQYGTVKWRLGQEVSDMITIVKYDLNTDLYSYIDALADIDISQRSKRLKKRLLSLENSKSLISMVDKAVNILKCYPTKGDIYFNLISDRYLKVYSNKVEDIINRYNISRRTYYRDISRATEIVGVILWGFIISNPSMR